MGVFRATGRGAAAAATWIGRRWGRSRPRDVEDDVDIPWRRAAATPRPLDVEDDAGIPCETRRGDAAAATRIYRGDAPRHCRGRDVASRKAAATPYLTP